MWWENINWGMVFLYASALFFWGLVFYANYKAVMSRIKKKRGAKNVESLIDKIKKDAMETLERMKKEAMAKAELARKESPQDNKPEVHTFQWRHQGKTNEVKIVIDPALDSVISGTREEFEQLVKTGNAGSLEDLLNGLSKADEKKKLAEVEQFTFSRKSVEQMKMAGISPDDLVAKMLKAAGRMD